MVQRENKRPITARRRFDSSRADSETRGGTKVLAAAHLALNQAGEGSSPSGPTSLTIRRLDGSRRARAGAFSIPSANANWMDPAAVGHAIGAWESLGIRLTWDQEIAGSNPAAPTALHSIRVTGRAAKVPVFQTGQASSTLA